MAHACSPLKEAVFLNTRQLECFIAVADHLNFTKAAESLYVAQSAVSQQIAELEKQLNTKLFIRNRRQVRLTMAGMVLYKEAKNILAGYDSLYRNVTNAAKGITGTLKFGISGRHLRNFLPDMIRSFRKLYPDIELRFYEYSHAAQVNALIEGEVDIIFPMRTSIVGVSGLNYGHVFTDENCVVVPAEHAFACYEEIDLKLMEKERFVFLNRNNSPYGYYSKISMCFSSGFTPNIVCEVENVDTILWLVESGMGASILPRSVQLDSAALTSFIRIKDKEPIFEVCVAWSSLNNNPAAALFIEMLHNDKKITHVRT